MSTLKTDTLKPVTSGGALQLAGDSGGVAVDGPRVDSAGDVDFSQNPDAKIKLPSGGGIYQSDGATPALIEASAEVSLRASLIKNASDQSLIEAGSLNSLGYVKHNPFHFEYYISGTGDIPSGLYSELGGSTSGINVSWAVQPTTTVAGSTNGDPFGKFDTGTGRWTPTISGFYFFSYFVMWTEDLNDQTLFYTLLTRNQTIDPGDDHAYVAFTRLAMAKGDTPSIGASGAIAMDTNDSVSIFVSHNNGNNRQISTGRIAGMYIGENL
tara:strand:- start:7324 stop:8127 length:804 start_codon:yes stop_codon:yes gene_type:complete